MVCVTFAGEVGGRLVKRFKEAEASAGVDLAAREDAVLSS
ncbi:hypothetical protein SAMN06272771_4775 [Streptomyces sp. Ag82_O1-12]|nr:hypothetical protein SAMN06272771_4775 [Streptomyces sp. Ag82_O1-12]SOD47364.1 hypothetical protein SAMN06272727_4775 [Streptomyces sp. Ag82_G6-1]